MRAPWQLVLATAVLGCRGATPAPNPTRPRSPLAIAADSLFWQTFHAGAYDQIPRTMRVLMAAHLQDPDDYRTTGYVAFLHTWRISERARLNAVAPEATDDIVLARAYFDQAIRLAPRDDPRLRGFDAVLRMSEGHLQHDSALWADGLARGRKAVQQSPEFNGFTLGYVLSAEPFTSALFREALELQWKTMDICSHTVIDRTNPDPALAVHAESVETDMRRRRACWDTWASPHNAEGFFLNMGDMLVKAGEWQTAERIYAHAKVMPGYAMWPFRTVLEARIRDAQANVARFREAGRGRERPARPVMMLGSTFACMACHQSR